MGSLQPHPPRLNYLKHTNPNPLHRWLLRRFHIALGELATEASRNLPLGNGQPLRVLEVGCGEGFVLQILRRIFPSLCYVGLDNAWPALSYARRGDQLADFACGDAGHLPFPSATFDLVLGIEVLEHLPQPLAALQELVRVSRGALLLSVPNQPFFAGANFLRGKNWLTWGDDPEHLHHWSARSFLRLLRGRVEVSRVVYPFPWVVVLGYAPTDQER